MARIVINTSSPNDGLGDSLRQAITDLNTMTAELYSTVVFQEAGKGLSSNDFTGPLQTKLTGIAAGAEVNVQADLLQADSTADSFIENKDALLPASPLSVMSGLAEGALLTINTDTAKFNRALGVAYIVDGHSDVDNPTVERVAIAELLAITTPFLATHEETYVAVDINGNNYLTSVPLTATERRNYTRLGVLIHKDNATITAIDFQPTVNIEAGAQIQDILEAIGFISKSGNQILPVGTNLKIKKEIGTVFKSGANFKNLTTQPHSFILPAQNPITFNYRTQTGVELAITTDINPAIIDVNGTFTAMPSTATFASIQRVYIFQDGVIVIQPGQRSFVDLPTAINLINSGVFINDTDIANNGLYLGAIAITRNNTNLSNTAEAIFIPSLGVSVNGSATTPALGYTPEDVANKQNNLTPDGTGAKYPTVDAINAGVILNQNASDQAANLRINGSGTFGSSVTASNFISNSTLSNALELNNTNSNAYSGVILTNDDSLQIVLGLGGSTVGGVFQNRGYVGTIDPIDFFLITNNQERVAIEGTTGATTFSSSVTAASHITTGGLATQLVKGDGNLTVGYKVYTALLTQTGTNAPVATILENTTAAVITWGYSSVGGFTGNSTGLFTASKTAILFSNGSANNGIFGAERSNSNFILLTSSEATTNSPANGLIQNATIEIRIYN